MRRAIAVTLLLGLSACAQKNEPKQEIRVTEFAMAQRAASLEKVRPYGLFRQAGREWEKLEMTPEELAECRPEIAAIVQGVKPRAKSA